MDKEKANIKQIDEFLKKAIVEASTEPILQSIFDKCLNNCFGQAVAMQAELAYAYKHRYIKNRSTETQDRADVTIDESSSKKFVEIKSVTTNDRCDIKKQLDSALTQLEKKTFNSPTLSDAARIAHVFINNRQNPWPFRMDTTNNNKTLANFKQVFLDELKDFCFDELKLMPLTLAWLKGMDGIPDEYKKPFGKGENSTTLYSVKRDGILQTTTMVRQVKVKISLSNPFRGEDDQNRAVTITKGTLVFIYNKIEDQLNAKLTFTRDHSNDDADLDLVTADPQQRIKSINKILLNGIEQVWNLVKKGFRENDVTISVSILKDALKNKNLLKPVYETDDLVDLSKLSEAEKEKFLDMSLRQIVITGINKVVGQICGYQTEYEYARKHVGKGKGTTMITQNHADFMLDQKDGNKKNVELKSITTDRASDIDTAITKALTQLATQSFNVAAYQNYKARADHIRVAHVMVNSKSNSWPGRAKQTYASEEKLKATIKGRIGPLWTAFMNTWLTKQPELFNWLNDTSKTHVLKIKVNLNADRAYYQPKKGYTMIRKVIAQINRSNTSGIKTPEYEFKYK